MKYYKKLERTYLRRDENIRGGFNDDAFSVLILISQRSRVREIEKTSTSRVTDIDMISSIALNDMEISSCDEVSYSSKLDYEMCDDYFERPPRACLLCIFTNRCGTSLTSSPLQIED